MGQMLSCWQEQGLIHSFKPSSFIRQSAVQQFPVLSRIHLRVQRSGKNTRKLRTVGCLSQVDDSPGRVLSTFAGYFKHPDQKSTNRKPIETKILLPGNPGLKYF